MRRVLFAIFSTIAGLVGLLTFRTETTSLAAPAVVTTTTGGSATTTSGAGTGSQAATSTTVPSSAASSSTSTTSGSASTKSTTSSTNAASSSSASATKTVSGNVVNTQYGPVEVKITVSNGKVTTATAVEYPSNDPRSQQINAYAVPVLEKETVGVSSANIDMVSGATYTSNGYLQSLQSALDKAGL